MSGTDAGFEFARAPDIEAELDRMAGEMMATLTQPEETLDLDGSRALLVDDVVYTGRTFARALDYVTGLGAAEVRCAALCVRRGRELPVRPAVVGSAVTWAGAASWMSGSRRTRTAWPSS